MSLGRIFYSNPYYSSNSILSKCLICNTCWVNPRPDENNLAHIYENNYHFDKNKIKDKLILSYIKVSYVTDWRAIYRYKNCGTVLDIGAGRGDFINSVSDSNWEKWVFDPYLSKGEISKLKNKIGKHVNNHRKLKDYPSGYFDVVILRNVLEHTTSTKILLKNIRRILKKDGILFVRTPNINSFDFNNFGTRWYVVEMSGHVIFWDKNSLLDILKKEGFLVNECKPTMSSAPLSLFRSVRWKVWQGFTFLSSIIYFILSIPFRNGGDLIAVATK